MSDTAETLPSVCYALVVDGEVASNFKISAVFEEWVAAFSSNPTIQLGDDTNETENLYTLTIDDEIATTMPIPKSDELINAIFQSNPTVIELTDEQLEIGIGPGWFWNGTEFTETQ